MTINTIIATLLRRIRGENPAKTVVRKSARIDRVVTTETAQIGSIIDAEIAGARTLASAALRRLDVIASTGMLNASQRRDADALRNFLGKTVAA